MSGPVSEPWDEREKPITFHGIPIIWDEFCPKCGRDFDLDPSPFHYCSMPDYPGDDE